MRRSFSITWYSILGREGSLEKKSLQMKIGKIPDSWGGCESQRVSWNTSLKKWWDSFPFGRASGPHSIGSIPIFTTFHTQITWKFWISPTRKPWNFPNKNLSGQLKINYKSLTWIKAFVLCPFMTPVPAAERTDQLSESVATSKKITQESFWPYGYLSW